MCSLNELPLNSQQERGKEGELKMYGHMRSCKPPTFRINDIGLWWVQRMILLSAFYITKWYRADSTYGNSIHRDHLRANYPSNHPTIQPLRHSTFLSKYHHSSLGHRRYLIPAGPPFSKKRSDLFFFIKQRIVFDLSSNISTERRDILPLYPFLSNSFRHDRREATINQRKQRQPLLSQAIS